MTDKREFRDMPLTSIEVRAEEDGNAKIFGHAAVFNQRVMIWDFEEEIMPGAFTKTVNDRADVFSFFNHDSNLILGRTKNNTLELREDDHGLFFSATPPDTSAGKDARTLIRDGYVDKASFGFEVMQQTWTEREGLPPLRQIQEVKLFEVSPVPFPAYGGTSISARGLGHKPEMPERSEPEPGPAPHSTLRASLRRRKLLKQREQHNVDSRNV